MSSGKHTLLLRAATQCITGMMLSALLTACGTSKVSVEQKFSPDELREDLDVLWKTYRHNHPSYDWYTPADSINRRFEIVRSQLTDSLTESQFRLRLSYAVAAIRCGHTAIIPPKHLTNTSNNRRQPSFPLQMRIWGSDSMVITQNRLGNNSPLKRGTVVSSINDTAAAHYINSMQQYTSVEGFATTFGEGMVSANFAQRYKWQFGLRPEYRIGYIDPAGNAAHTVIKNYQPPNPDSLPKRPDSLVRRPAPARPPAYGSFKVDSSGKFAVMELNTFSPKHLRKFFRQSFKTLRKQNIPNLVLDVRSNTGGRISKSTLLAKYLADHPFRVADSISAVSFHFPYPKQVQYSFFYRWFGWVIASKQEDNRWHMRSMEKKLHQPKHKNHFAGQTYILTSGFSFSATILFLQTVKDQPNICLVGEETGGAARGNSAVMTPNITLPNSKVRARLPMFRTVIDASLPQDGRGIMPDVPVSLSSYNYRYGIDGKMEKVKQLIAEGYQKPNRSSISH